MRMQCYGAQTVPRHPTPNRTKGVLALCRREATLGEYRTYVKQPSACQLPTKTLQLCLF